MEVTGPYGTFGTSFMEVMPCDCGCLCRSGYEMEVMPCLMALAAHCSVGLWVCARWEGRDTFVRIVVASKFLGQGFRISSNEVEEAGDFLHCVGL